MAQAWNSLEAGMYQLGFMEGYGGMAKRAVLGAAVGAGVVWAVRPASMFFADGTPRPWSLTESGKGMDKAVAYNNPGGGQASTAVPWLAGPAVGAFVFSQLL